MPPFRCAECPLRGAELWLFCRSEAARLSELRADRNIAHGELTAAPVSLDAPVERRNDRPLMADVGDQHNGGLSSGKAVLGTAREVDYLKVCHDALTDIWLLGDDTETSVR